MKPYEILNQELIIGVEVDANLMINELDVKVIFDIVGLESDTIFHFYIRTNEIICPFTQFTSLDFDEIKAQIKDFLRSNSNFSDFDFEGSNFSVLIDTLAYNTYINAFNANLVANESFLDSATIRENVISLGKKYWLCATFKNRCNSTIKY